MTQYVQQAKTCAADMRVLVGIERYLQSMPLLVLGGTSFTPDELAAFVQGRVQAAQELEASRTRHAHAVTQYRVVDRRARQVLLELRTLVLAMFGADSAAATTFGFKSPKPRKPMTPAQKAARAAKCAATRRARGTMGSKQRLAIHGKVPGTP
jgi:hypothetical protein